MNQTSVELNINGMKCGGCVNSVKNAIKSVAGVEQVEVSLDNHNAIIKGSAAVDELITAVKAAGYEASQT